MREKILFNTGWRFHKGDIKVNFPADKGPLYVQAKTERFRSGPASVYYSDTPDSYETNRCFPSEKWEYVTLPHDYVIFGTPDKKENNARGYLKYDNAWYRKNFTLPEEDKGKRLVLQFEGIGTYSTVYLNGCVLKRNFSGYNSFDVDITDFAVIGGSNLLAVYVNSDEHEGWWYEGAGIYRNVWLLKTDEVAIDTYGTYFNPARIGENDWKIDIEATVVSSATSDAEIRVESEIIDTYGTVIAKSSQNGIVCSCDKVTLRYESRASNPTLWDIENPHLYKARTRLYRNGELIDEESVNIGFRYFECDAERGFILNGKRVKIKGVCAHEDCGLLGKAVPENVHRYKMKMLKEMGANGYRTSHYQQNSAILDAADELGFIVLDEARWFSSSEECVEQLETLVKRDRNRPSVFFWSLSNEEYYHLTEQGRKITKTLMRALRRLDKSRPVTSAVDKSPNKATVFEELDVIGINYNLGLYDEIREKYPKKAIFSSENCATGTTRAWYAPDCKERGYLSAYDKDTNSWFRGREVTWKFINERDWVMGGYQWAGFEHRGETVWPRLCSQSGAIDLFLQRKDAFYQNQSHWKSEPMIHMLPHWNIDCFGEPVNVRIYTNCDEAELILNGRSLGKKSVPKNTAVEWQVEYEAGRIEAIGYKDGVRVVSNINETASEPETLMLKLENSIEKPGDVAIITCYTVDSYGRRVPDASPCVEFYTNSLGKVISTGSDVSDHTSLSSLERKMRAGYISLAVGVATVKGEYVSDSGSIEVYATSQGLRGAKLKIEF